MLDPSLRRIVSAKCVLFTGQRCQGWNPIGQGVEFSADPRPRTSGVLGRKYARTVAHNERSELIRRYTPGIGVLTFPNLWVGSYAPDVSTLHRNQFQSESAKTHPKVVP